jgi:anthranilate/para-aminobenzoate synthase component I
MRKTILKSQRRWKAGPEGIPDGTDPWAVAEGLSHAPGLVFLDSSAAASEAESIIAVGPGEIIEGDGEGDWTRLRAAIAARAGEPGMAAGYVEYEGRFRFALYDTVLRYSHGEALWREGGADWDFEPTPNADVGAEAIHFRPETAARDYERSVVRAQEYIAAGDIYQVNLAHRFTAGWSGRIDDAMAFYGRLRARSPAPYAALICETGGRVIASSSPELFLQMRGREIMTRPIKGTRPRASAPAADASAEAELMSSAKERAELIMITDLERNDLGQVCDYGTVSAPELLKLERYAQVHHLVSTVTGRLRADVDHVGALRACFPGGSITGAPKKRAREIIRELEPTPRGLYTGAIGYFGFDGRSAFNIAIRTAILEPGGLAHFHTGAGIVADSIPAHEWQETLWKAAGLLQAGETCPDAATR